MPSDTQKRRPSWKTWRWGPTESIRTYSPNFRQHFFAGEKRKVPRFGLTSYDSSSVERVWRASFTVKNSEPSRQAQPPTSPFFLTIPPRPPTPVISAHIFFLVS